MVNAQGGCTLTCAISGVAEGNPSFYPPFLGPIYHTKDAGLESMALEVGTVQGGQIAALGSYKEAGAGDTGALVSVGTDVYLWVSSRHSIH